MDESPPNVEELILGCLRADASAEERAALDQWRRAAPANEATYQETARLWALLSRAPADDPGQPVPSAATLIARAGIAPLRPLPTDRLGGPGRPVITWRRAVAAAILLAIGSSAGVLWHGRRPAPPSGVNEFATGRSETATVTLVDGTVVRLGPESRLQLESEPSIRRVSFQGKAFFAVAHEDEPFLIRTPAGEVRVLGTRFELEVGAKDLQVTVVEGQVAVRARGSETLVHRGELGRVVSGVAVPPIKAADLDTPTRWLGTFFAFQSTPLREAAIEIRRRSGIAIEIADSGLGQRTVTGYFDDRDPGITMGVICAAVVADCTVRPGRVTMRPQ